MTVFARWVGWYFHWTDRLGQECLRRMWPDDADEQDLNDALTRLAADHTTKE